MNELELDRVVENVMEGVECGGKKPVIDVRKTKFISVNKIILRNEKIFIMMDTSNVRLVLTNRIQ
jgi:hypothetical protein